MFGFFGFSFLTTEFGLAKEFCDHRKEVFCMSSYGEIGFQIERKKRKSD
jgi:hypothetical protein